MVEERIRIIIPKSESELESCVSGDLVKVKIIDSQSEFQIYIKDSRYDMFISQNKIEKYKINCWYSQRRFLQFDENDGVWFDSFHSNFMLIDDKYSSYNKFVGLLKKSEMWSAN